MSFINNNSMLLLQKGLDFTWQRQIVTMNNISNAETPGFKAKKLSFEEELASRMSNRSGKKSSQIGKDIMNARSRIGLTNNENTKLDGNNVAIDAENVELSRTSIQYQYLQRMISDEFTKISMAIKG